MIAARKIIEKLAIAGSMLLLLALAAAAESSDQNFPTPVTTNEIDGTIRVRDMGDSRVTSYFYAFDGAQGDIFINVVTKNFSGDIDVFSVEGMTPLAKMVIDADAGASETGRLIYLRKPERMILRIEGRSPNDDPATFRIKFGGSFIALSPQKVEDAPTVARVGTNEPGVKVNSVGTIVAVIPKPRPTPKPVEPKPEPPVVAKAEPTPDRNASVNERAPAEPATAKVTKPKTPPAKNPADTTKTTILENEKATVTVEEPPKPEAVEREPTNAPKAVKKSGPPASAVGKAAKPKTTPTSNPTAKPPEPKPPEAKPVDPLANVRLVIQMKDGTTFWMPMNEVVKFTVDKGVMTVIAKNGSTTRYNILDVEKTTIQ